MKNEDLVKAMKYAYLSGVVDQLNNNSILEFEDFEERAKRLISDNNLEHLIVDETPNKHWYIISFVNSDEYNTSTITTTTYAGFDDKLITIKRLHQVRIDAKIPLDAPITNLVYLGYMTEKEFEG